MENNKSRYDKYQKLEIEKGLESGIDISFYENPQFLPIQMQQIRMGLEAGIDVTLFAKPEYDWYQMEEISKGLFDKVDVSKYADPSIPHEKMRQIRLGLAERLDLSTALDVEAPIMEQIRLAIKEKVDILPYVKKGYSADQLKEIRLALENNAPIDEYIDINMHGASMEQIRIGLERGLDVAAYAKDYYSWRQMKQIRLGMESRVETSVYANPLYSWQQMKQIRLALEEGLEVATFMSLSNTAKQMESMRIKMLESAKAELEKNFKSLSKEYLDLQISADAMIARISIKPEKADEIRVTDIKRMLEENGIVYGVLEESIDESLKYSTNLDIVVAKGKAAIDGEDGYYKYYFDTHKTKEPEILEDGTLDYSNTKWFEIVDANVVVAKYIPPTMGEDGITIYGEKVASKKGKPKKISFGKNIIRSEDNNTFLSAVEGEIKYLPQKEKIILKKAHVVRKDQRLIENVYSKGSVLIESDPGSGVEIRSDSDIAIYGILGPAKIISGGNVFIRGGVKGKDKCTIKAKGDVISKFFESCEIHTEGNVIAGNILNCTIEAENKVMLPGTKSTIVGGIVKAEKGIDTYSVGNSNLSDTVLEVGKSGYSRRDLMDTNKRIEYVEIEIQSIENSIKKLRKHTPLEELSQDSMYTKLEESMVKKTGELKKLKEKIKELELSIANNVEANIIIRGTAYEGVKVYIGENEWEANGDSVIELSMSKNNYIKVNKLS